MGTATARVGYEKKKKKKRGMGPKAKTDSWLNEINLIKQRLVQELKLI